MNVRLWDCDFPEVELKGWGSRTRKEKRQKNSGQKNGNGAQDDFYFSVRYFSVDGAIRLGFRLLTRAALLFLRLLSRIVIRVDVVDYERPDGMHLNHGLAFGHGEMARPFRHSDE
jgi:hypothetical protein